LITDFFSNESIVNRLVVYKDVVNKSRRRGDIPLYQFYINMLPEDKLIFLVQIKKGSKVKVFNEEKNKDEMIPFDQHIIHSHVKRQKERKEEIAKKIIEK